MQSLLTMQKNQRQSQVIVKHNSSADEIDEIDSDSALRQNSEQVGLFTNIWSDQYAYANVTVIAGQEVIKKDSTQTAGYDVAEKQPHTSEDTLQNLERELGIEESKSPVLPVIMNKIQSHLVELKSIKFKPLLRKK